MADAERRLTWLQSQENWSDMKADAEQVVQEDPYWANQVRTDAGTKAFYEHMKYRHAAKKAAQLESENVRRKAKAPQKATPKGSQKKSAPADTFADEMKKLKKMSPEDRIAAIVDGELGA